MKMLNYTDAYTLLKSPGCMDRSEARLFYKSGEDGEVCVTKMVKGVARRAILGKILLKDIESLKSMPNIKEGYVGTRPDYTAIRCMYLMYDRSDE